MVFKVGLTGGVASGKSTVTSLFHDKYHIDIIDADRIAHTLLTIDSDCYSEVVEAFGESVLLDNREINRRYLRERIFHNDNDKQRLEKILHPAIRQQLFTQAASSTSAYCIMSVPLLIEVGIYKEVDRVCVIDVSLEKQLERLQMRDNISMETAQAMIKSQCDRQLRLQHADDIINNNDSVDSLAHQVAQLHELYLKFADK
ncbi:dephospho-CoA kinase [Methylophaga aminisulfidivorans MP]|uniref:Dephospho-CoA kinase n=1 Tax=Methylophaga aminisulfidivorans MP TaxID=1026882 RepID=F5SZA3_9GAMM|nr:dephospho-CoA kinase [Methylophaga aminisulfidivorans]EGL54626.1 dephospho-CoA kinase [Methylophaga aminisulfidivorans MP]